MFAKYFFCNLLRCVLDKAANIQIPKIYWNYFCYTYIHLTLFIDQVNRYNFFVCSHSSITLYIALSLFWIRHSKNILLGISASCLLSGRIIVSVNWSYVTFFSSEVGEKGEEEVFFSPSLSVSSSCSLSMSAGVLGPKKRRRRKVFSLFCLSPFFSSFSFFLLFFSSLSRSPFRDPRWGVHFGLTG